MEPSITLASVAEAAGDITLTANRVGGSDGLLGFLTLTSNLGPGEPEAKATAESRLRAAARWHDSGPR